jgi:hypothetical protein
MKYKNGIQVQEGDIITLRMYKSNLEGVIVKVVHPSTEDADHWSLPEGGVLIEGGGIGLLSTDSLEEDEDVVFICRAQGAITLDTQGDSDGSQRLKLPEKSEPSLS